ncbi:MAG TPA: PH domain-containing protein [Qipengyuania sp.]|nr:PH domain-containing protein [Qipengyuania sp.]
MDHDQAVTDDRDGSTPIADDDEQLTPLHPDHVKVLRIRAALAALPLAIGALVLETAQVLPTGLVIAPIALAAALAIARVPLRRYHATGYSVGLDRLRIVRGLWFRSDTVVPFGRVQHIDVGQGPLERLYGLATLTVHTAGTHNASVLLPGLTNEHAMALREDIRAHVKREML